MSYFVREDPEELYNDGVFFDYFALADITALSVTMNSIAIFFILIRVTWILRINKRANNLMLTIEMASKNVISYMILLIPIFIGFTLVSMNILGPYYMPYRNIFISLMSNLMFTVGSGDIVAMFRVNREWASTIFILFWFVIVFLVLSVFLGIIMDAYRMVRMKHGYTDELGQWDMQNYFDWALAWLPWNARSKLKEFVFRKKTDTKTKKTDDDNKEGADKAAQGEEAKAPEGETVSTQPRGQGRNGNPS